MKFIKYITVILLILVFMLCAINHLVFKIGYGIPGGEIDFVGLTKIDAIKKLQEKKIGDLILIFVGGYKGRSYKNINEVEKDPYIIQSKILGVNCKQAGNVNYMQILFFDETERVYKQKISYSFDGP